MKNLLVILVGLLLTSGSLFGQQKDADDYNKTIKKYRKDYVKALLTDERAPLESKKQAKLVEFYEPNEDFVVKCLFIGTSQQKPFEMATYSGETKPYIKYGELLFEIEGKGTHRISVYQSLKALKLPQYKDHLFVPFKDLTTGESTYGGGRYIDLRQSDIDKGIVNLDFNKAYNPWCAYSDGFSCPIPPQENELNIAIEAGELAFAKDQEDEKS
jgi:uncharacterized protein (DUF1684 family)